MGLATIGGLFHQQDLRLLTWAKLYIGDAKRDACLLPLQARTHVDQRSEYYMVSAYKRKVTRRPSVVVEAILMKPDVFAQLHTFVHATHTYFAILQHAH